VLHRAGIIPPVNFLSAQMSHPLDAIFRPQSVAVVGASNAPEKYGYVILKNILDAGFSGPLYPVNPKAEEILGRPCVRSIADLPPGVDLAVIIIPARAVPQTLTEAGAREIKAAVIISGGFAESGEEGSALQGEVVEVGRRSGIRVVGPNCQGVNNPHHGLCASWPLLTKRGEIAVISQSGTVGAALMDWASQEQLGCSTFVSLGNRADVDETDVIDYLANDPHTQAIAVYLEGIKDLDRFRQVVSGCPKPIVILKAGRTVEGRRAAESHTRSLAGRDELYTALFRQLKVHRADSLEDLYDAAKVLAYLPSPAGRRLLIITSSGGSGILATDWAEWSGLAIPPLADQVVARLRGLLPRHCIVANPLDLTGDATAALYRTVVEATVAHVDYQVIIFGDPILDAAEVVTHGAPQLVIFLGGADVERRERERMHLKKVPVFPTPERGIRALARLFAYDEGRS
jgi:acyl-CoA synthetase (NDP forming)